MGQIPGVCCREPDWRKCCVIEDFNEPGFTVQVLAQKQPYGGGQIGLQLLSCEAPSPKLKPHEPQSQLQLQAMVSQQQVLRQLVSDNTCERPLSRQISPSSPSRQQKVLMPFSASPSCNSSQTQTLTQMANVKSGKSLQRSYSEQTKASYEMAFCTASTSENLNAELRLLRDQATALQRVVRKPNQDSSIITHYDQELRKIMQRITDLEVQGMR